MPIPPTAPNLRRPVLREEVYSTLREWIAEGVLEAGEKLKDHELAERLGVSRTPVREALRRLEDEGLVETAKNRWTRVSRLDLQDAERIYPIVSALEVLALELAFPKLTAKDWAAMRRANRELQKALEVQQIPEAVDADEAFHQRFILHCENPELAGMLQALKLKYRRLEQAYFSGAGVRESLDEHGRLLAALERGDLEGAKKALADNWQGSLRRLRARG
jgi:DNA-binding GntR family transcriptional regulator